MSLGTLDRFIFENTKDWERAQTAYHYLNIIKKDYNLEDEELLIYPTKLFYVTLGVGVITPVEEFLNASVRDKNKIVQILDLIRNISYLYEVECRRSFELNSLTSFNGNESIDRYWAENYLMLIRDAIRLEEIEYTLSSSELTLNPIFSYVKEGFIGTLRGKEIAIKFLNQINI